ncbi:hypothetical protein PAESOLCIP111_05001 [Paenibacillus solanacearum]|uniref:Aminoglycoside phosphotransferase domain-containing protein n=1 Tax=Paenibacillus solanacearum TaxID=2048548 RepID=A0A916K5A8_9BACL|nr:aminoglycoside phosphotransferase family protein [Paenibacillus solanacearum]CAG7645700.1 hypothetical protein PAESOLCIP111_05001 [Paenibacillus solanacearum]
MQKNDAPSIEQVKPIAEECLHTFAISVERVLHGVSTYVYRLEHKDSVMYLRILPEKDRSFGAEVQVHSALRELGVWVPEVMYYAPGQRIWDMSFMIVNEIAGANVIGDCPPPAYEEILFEAGKQLALIHQVQVNGYSWVKRDSELHQGPLQGEQTSLHDYVNEGLEEKLALLSQHGFQREEVAAIRSIFHAGISLMEWHGSRLVHGDFDDDHIFAHQGIFTGIIDFGEIQGSSPLYDLGHYKLHDGQHHSGRKGFRSLAAGYSEVSALSAEDQTEISLWAIWIGVRRLARRYKYNRPNSAGHWGRVHDYLRQKVQLEIRLLGDRL